MIKKPASATPETAFARLSALCAASEQCKADLRKKMARMGLSGGQAEMVIDKLEAQSFVDDSRFARAYAHDKLMFNGWGRFKISQGLWAKGIGRTEIDNALASLDEADYRKRAFAVMRARARGLRPTRDEKMRLLRFGTGRGFETALLVKIINSEALWRRQDS